MEAMLLWGLILLMVALGIVVVEVFVPSAGLLSLAAVAVATAGIVCLFKYDTLWGFIGLLSVAVIGPSVLYAGFKIMPHTPMGRKLILGGPAAEGDRPPPGVSPMLALIGREGVVVSDLRPIGVVRVGDATYDAMSETSLVRAGVRVRVSAVEGLNVKVRPIEGAGSSPSIS